MYGGGSNDPFAVGESLRSDVNLNNHGNTDIGTKIARSAAITVGQRVCVLIYAGDSNSVGIAPDPYTPVNKVDNLNIYDGALYKAADPLLGCANSSFGPGNISSRIADKIISGGKFDRVIIASVGIGGTATTHWIIGGIMGNRIPCAILRLAQLGITPSTPNVTFVLINQIGANEPGNASYKANVINMMSAVTRAGFVGKVFVPVYSMLGGVIDATVQSQETSLVDNIQYFSGGNIDNIPTGLTYRFSDNTHFNTAGQAGAATIIYTAMQATGAF